MSLIPSATEIVAALGAADLLVGRSHECDHPPEVARLPVLTSAKIGIGGTGAEIDREVKALLRDALSVYRVDEAALKRLRPDIVLTQTQCEVCAVGLAEVERALSRSSGPAPRLVSLAPAALSDVLADFGRVAAALDRVEAGRTLIDDMRRRMSTVAESASRIETRPRVAPIEWIDPPMAAGNWMPELVAMAGGVPLFGEAGRHSGWLDWHDLVAADPDAIVVMPCGFDVERTRREMPALTTRPGWSRIRAVVAGRVFLVDGNRYFNRPGPRLAESLEILAEILYPERFRFGHEGDGWVRWAESA